ncbi:MAG: stage V sporulation protein AB [Lachnospiraceae bacterium]|mgnify:CR=1 FL=1|nr:stage V sporulation protein AB [Lachnospiraceae bacterium]
MEIVWENILLGFIGLGSGVLTACGVFTILIVVGMVPRFAGKTKTATNIPVYEDMVALGALIGNCLWLYREQIIYSSLWSKWVRLVTDYEIISRFILGISGFFIGAFVGCLAISIAEMMDGIPIVGRKIPSYIRKSFGAVLVSIAIGKLAGSLAFFWIGDF